MSNGIIEDLSQRVLSEDHLPLEWWERTQVDVLEKLEGVSAEDAEVLRANPAVWRAFRSALRREKEAGQRGPATPASKT